MSTLQSDQRVLDFCGEQVKPGWIITKKTQPNETWIKYELTVKGQSGKLKTTVIGDYLTHKELCTLEEYRKEFQKSGKTLKEDDVYVPTDFDAYSIPDGSLQVSDPSLPISEDERIWRIASLTAFIDSESKILILPLPEYKRKVKIADTKYQLATYKDLLEKADDAT